MNRAGGLGAFRTASEVDHCVCGVEGNPRQKLGGGCPLPGLRDDAGQGQRGLQEVLQVVPSPARAVRVLLLSPSAPRNSARPSPDARARSAPGPGEGGAREEERAPKGGTHLRSASRGGGRPGRGEGAAAHPPAAGLSWAPGSPALRPLVPKLLNLPAAHALRGQRPTRHIGPLGRLGPALALPSAPLGGPPLTVRPVPCSPSRLRSAAAPSPEKGQSSARTREGIPPPLCSPTPEPAPLPGIRSKKRTGAPGPGVRSPLPPTLARSEVAALGARGWRPHARSGPWRGPCALAPPFPARPPPADFTRQSRGCRSGRPGAGTGPKSLSKPQFPSRDHGK